MTDFSHKQGDAGERLDADAKAHADAEARRLARRRVVKIGLGVAPVVLTIKARPAWSQGGDPQSSSTLSSQMSSQPGTK
jgi:hypothetical protein